MNIESLDFLTCPGCHSGFEIKEITKQENNKLITGIVECECNKYPILEGILILRESFPRLGITKLVEQGKIEEAIIHSLFIDYFEKLDNYHLPIHSKFTWYSEKVLRKLGKSQLNSKSELFYKEYTDPEVSFYNLLGKSFADTYYKQRFSSESFWSLFSFLPLLAEKKDRILDLSCGVGHSSFVLESYVKPSQLFSADFSFRNLYLAKKYFAPNAEFICLDTNESLPFKPGVFSSVLMLDAFHYIRSRALSASELERVTTSTGLLLLLHIHNSLVSNLGAGIEGLTPKTLSNLFADKHFETKVMPEKNVLENFLINDELRLAVQYGQDKLNSSNAMIMLGTKKELSQTTYKNVCSDFLKIEDNLIINPIYKIENRGDLVHLKRSSGDLVFGDHLPTSEDYLPKEIEVQPKSLNGRRIQISDPKILKELQKKFVIINMPEKYV